MYNFLQWTLASEWELGICPASAIIERRSGNEGKDSVSATTQELANQTRILAGQRQAQAQKCYQQGMALLQQAITEQFTHPASLQRAGQSFLKAIQLDGQNPTPCLGFAQILLILEDHTLARQYAEKALALNPADSLAQDFLKRIQQDQAGEVASLYAATSLDDFELIEDKIRQAVQAAQQQKVPGPSSEPGVIATLEAHLADFRQQHTGFVAQLKSLEWEFTTENLSYTLFPLEALISQLEQALRVSKGFQGMLQLIEADLTHLYQGMRQSLIIKDGFDMIVLEKQLELLLDHSDAYGHKLESLAGKNLCDDRVTEAFQRLQQNLDVFRDMIDEAQARLELLQADSPHQTR